MERRYLLDTNIVIFWLSNKKELERGVVQILTDSNIMFYVSVISVQEMIHLVNSGRLKNAWRSASDILPSIDALNINLLPVKREHLETYAMLQTAVDHNDHFDHIIISQAITERMALISSDHKFKKYVNQKLTFIHNER